MKRDEIQRATKIIEAHIPVGMPTTAWYFLPPGAPQRGSFVAGRTCMLRPLAALGAGEGLTFSAHNHGCAGAALYLGFRQPSATAGTFLAEQECFKMNRSLGQAFYDQVKARPPSADRIAVGRIWDLPVWAEVEVVNLWVRPAALSALVTLANYDRSTNDNVSIPFASACQALWTLPYKEARSSQPRAVVGGLDPAARGAVPGDHLTVSMPAARLREMADNVPGSFLELERWRRLATKERLIRSSEPGRMEHRSTRR